MNVHGFDNINNINIGNAHLNLLKALNYYLKTLVEQAYFHPPRIKLLNHGNNKKGMPLMVYDNIEPQEGGTKSKF